MAFTMCHNLTVVNTLFDQAEDTQNNHHVVYINCTVVAEWLARRTH